MNQKECHEYCQGLAAALNDMGGEIEEVLMEIYSMAIQAHSVPKPGKIDCSEDVRYGLKEFQKSLKRQRNTWKSLIDADGDGVPDPWEKEVKEEHEKSDVERHPEAG